MWWSMAELPTVADLAAVGQGKLRAQLDPNGTGLVDLRAGSKNDIAISVNSAMAAKNTAYIADRLAASLLANASGDDLDTIGRDRYHEERKVAVAAVGTLYLQRTGTAATSIPAGSRFSVPANGSQKAVTFETTVDVLVAINSLKTRVDVRCTETGAQGNVLLSAVTAIVDPLPDTTWALFVPIVGDAVLAGDDHVDVIGGGAAVETDDQYRVRLDSRAIDVTLRAGTREAIIAGALRVPGVNEVVLVEPGDGTTALYCGDTSYRLPNALKQAIDQELLNWRAYGVPVRVRAFTVTDVIVAGTVYMGRDLSAYDPSAVKLAAVNAVINYFATGRATPDEYYRNGIEAAIFASNDEVQQVTLTAPASDVNRPSPSAYASSGAISRYRVTTETITLAISGPLVV